ncbi:MAG: FdrA family protein [Nocardioidaceae bacterium]
MRLVVKIFAKTYVDSVVQLGAMKAMREIDGVHWASVAMATPANVHVLRAEGVDPDELADTGSNDLLIVVRASSAEVAEDALAVGAGTVFSVGQPRDEHAEALPMSLREALARQPESNVAVISVPGDYATLAAFQALAEGLHVLLFSDNVPIEKEIALKDFARGKGLLVMGPGAGTAMLAGVGLGFCNVVRPGRVGVVAAAGTGAQEAMCLLDHWGVGVRQVLGLGGRDLSDEVGGSMARSAIGALRDDPDTEVILFVSKPPAASVASSVLASAEGSPVVAALIGLDADFAAPDGVVLADTLEGGVIATLRLLGHPIPDTTKTHGPSVQSARRRMAAQRTLVRGLFSGGTLCYESLVILGRILGEVRSNAPINKAWSLPAPPGSHQCLDLGEEEYTKGRPHPMIDAEARLDQLREHGSDPLVAAIILDVVLGYGANPDPAGVLAPVCAEIMKADGPQVVAYVLGSDQDPQGFAAQRSRLVEAGCIVTGTAARASLVAAALATGDPAIVGRPL